MPGTWKKTRLVAFLIGMFVVAMFVVAGSPSGAHANDEAQLQFRNVYRVVPVTTEAQRALLSCRDAAICVVVIADPLLNEDTVSANKLMLSELQSAVWRLREQIGNDEGRVVFHIVHTHSLDQPSGNSNAGRLLLAAALRGSLVFEKLTPRAIETMQHRQIPLEGLGKLLDTPDEPGADETPIGNDVITVYPVQTRLSQYLTTVTTRCYVEVHPTVGKDPDQRIPGEVLSALEEFTRRFIARDKVSTLYLRFQAPREPVNGIEFIDWLTGESLNNGPGADLAKSLGFDSYRARIGSEPPPQTDQ